MKVIKNKYLWNKDDQGNCSGTIPQAITPDPNPCGTTR